MRSHIHISDDGSVVTGLFAYAVDAAQAIHMLEARGFGPAETSILMSDELVEIFRAEHAASRVGVRNGALLAALAEGFISIGALVPDGVQVVVAGAAALATQGGEAASTPERGVRSLVSYGLPEAELAAFAQEVAVGKILIAVQCSNQGQEIVAERALRRAGAERTTRA